jgi:hypothetical protein
LLVSQKEIFDVVKKFIYVILHALFSILVSIENLKFFLHLFTLVP